MRRHNRLIPLKTRATILYMKTMLELLIRLQELRDCCERAAHNPQLTGSEKAAVFCFKNLVRDCLPAEVLIHYDRLRKAEPELLECPEVFAMAVLVSTYRRLSPRQRRRLVNHFATPPRVRSGCTGHTAAQPACGCGRQVGATCRQLVLHS